MRSFSWSIIVYHINSKTEWACGGYFDRSLFSKTMLIVKILFVADAHERGITINSF